MTKEEAVKFLKQAVRDEDIITFITHKILPIAASYTEYHYSIYNGLINIGPAMVVALQGMPINKGDTYQLSIREGESSTVITYTDMFTLLHMLEDVLGDILLDWNVEGGN